MFEHMEFLSADIVLAPAADHLHSNVSIAGFEITVDHPHTDVVRCSQLVRGILFFLSSRCVYRALPSEVKD